MQSKRIITPSMVLIAILILLSACDKGITTLNDKGITTLNVSGIIDGHEYVDLGLSVKWATCNLGAQEPNQIGELYAWGETTPYTEWTAANYNISYAPCNTECILDTQFDAVTANWGESWRMPTKKEINELIDPNKCEWIWVDNIDETGVSGYKVKSKINGGSIFLPAAHKRSNKPAGNYWCSTTTADVFKTPFSHSPFTIFFVNGVHYEGISLCSSGLCVRGVVGNPTVYFPKKEEYTSIDNNETSKQGFTVSGKAGTHTYVDLGLPSRTLWATYNVGASMPHEYGEYYAWGETAPKEIYEHDNYKYFLGHSDSGPDHWAQYSKYVWYDQHGTPDYILTLEPEDDAAYVNWGTRWRMPTKEQAEEISYYCWWYQKTLSIDGKAVQGWIAESKINGYKMFIPAADKKYRNVSLSYLTVWYWTRDLTGDPKYYASGTDYRAWYISVDPQHLMTVEDCNRIYGFPVRAVVNQQ